MRLTRRHFLKSAGGGALAIAGLGGCRTGAGEIAPTSGRRVIVVPLLVSFGGIEKGLRERLEGLTYTMASSGLMPDDRLATWVLEMATTR